MQYFGGKARLAPRLVPVLQAALSQRPYTVYWEPFCGALNTFYRINFPHRIASDACEPLIALYQYMQGGGTLPTTVSEADYAQAKAGNCPDWYRAFVGFGCSFAGKWFGGYARGGHGADAATAQRSLGRKFGRNYAGSYEIVGDILNGAVRARYLIYCDPSYAGTTGYTAVPGRWDASAFWAWAQQQARQHTVWVSEYACPVPHRLVAAWPHRTDMRTPTAGDQNTRVERLFEILPLDTLPASP